MPINNAVANSSNKIIAKGFEKIIKTQIPNERWIGPKNIYAKNAITTIQTTGLASDLKKNQLSEYVASSAVLHCYDGWNFLSRAGEALINGDISSAVHFIYYSELRSVMSLMASEGIGVFNNKHVWFDETETPHFMPGGTHTVADQCIKAWSSFPSKKETIFKFIKVKNNKLDSWINATQFTVRSKYSSLIAKDWLENWSFDLRLNEDRDLRNEMSYRPHFKIRDINIRDTVSNFLAIWKGLEPTGVNEFNELDNHLFRIAIEQVYRKWKGRKPTGSDFRKFVDKMFDKIGESRSQRLYNFLLRNSDQDDHFIITEARRDLKDKRINLDNPFPMFCRAVLMLRLSTGASKELISNSTLDKEDIRFWWEGICKGIGIFTGTDSVENTSDLFNDIGASLNSFQMSPSSSLNSLKDALPEHSMDLNIIKQFQRGCFWGVGI